MNAAHVKTTMAALAIAATPPHPQASTTPTGPVPARAAGAAPQGAAPRAAALAFTWDTVVAELNAANGFSQSRPCPDPQLAAIIVGEAAR